jgi:SAM-dependent methyltransferase
MSAANELKTVFTQYWQFMALRGACRLSIFEAIAQKPGIIVPALAETLDLHEPNLRLLVLALADYGILDIDEKDRCYLTEKGELLTDCHPKSLKNACLLWGEEHLDAWRHLPQSVKTGRPAFDLVFGTGFFEYLTCRPEALENYQLAMSEYARDDYAGLADALDFSTCKTIADVGGGIGMVVKLLARRFQEKDFIVFDRPEVIDTPSKVEIPNIRFLGGDFFQPMPFTADAILLARVLHDWPDDAAEQILENCHRALPVNGRLFILEILRDRTPAPALDLHMALICGSRERNCQEYENLLVKMGFELLEAKPFNALQSILVAQKTKHDDATLR